MNNTFLEDYYEKVILPLYKNESIRAAAWKDHGKVGPNTYAHYFENSDGIEFVLLNEDFPNGDYLNDELTHAIIPIYDGSEGITLQVHIGNEWIPNISGYFTLYKERGRR